MNQPVDHKVDGLIRFRLDLAYDGTEYWGFAQQKNFKTVQGELLKALTTILVRARTILRCELPVAQMPVCTPSNKLPTSTCLRSN